MLRGRELHSDHVNAGQMDPKGEEPQMYNYANSTMVPTMIQTRSRFNTLNSDSNQSSTLNQEFNQSTLSILNQSALNQGGNISSNYCYFIEPTAQFCSYIDIIDKKDDKLSVRQLSITKGRTSTL